MLNELLTIVESIERERGISRDLLIKALETAILTASRKSIHPASNLEVKIEPATCKIQVWAKLEIVESNPNNDQLLLARAQERMPDAKVGDIVDWEVTPRNFGRIAAQTAKQAIMQQLRQAEKLAVQGEFANQIDVIFFYNCIPSNQSWSVGKDSSPLLHSLQQAPKKYVSVSPKL